MKRKEAIIRCLVIFGRADRNQIANYILAKLTVVTTRLQELKHAGLVQYIKWSDGNKVWVLTQDGYRRYDYYEQRNRRGENAS